MAANMVDRISKLLAMAEDEGGNENEREVAMTQALKLSQAYSIDLAVARAATVKKERAEVPEKRSFRVGQDRLKASKNAHFVDLMIAICETNDIEVTISGSNTYVFGVGMPSDLDMAERFFALLAPQMIQEADAGLKNGDNGEWRDGEPKRRRVEIPEEERAWGQHDGTPGKWSEAFHYDDEDEHIEDWGDGPCRQRTDWATGRNTWVKSYPPPKFRNEVVTDDDGNVVTERKWVSTEDARLWRVNFYQGFVNRARYRLREAKKDAMRDAGIDYKDDTDSRAVAIRDKKKEVREVFEEENQYVLSTGRTYGGAQVSKYAHGGQEAGDAAGQRATLGNERDLSHG